MYIIHCIILKYIHYQIYYLYSLNFRKKNISWYYIYFFKMIIGPNYLNRSLTIESIRNQFSQVLILLSIWIIVKQQQTSCDLWNRFFLISFFAKTVSSCKAGANLPEHRRKSILINIFILYKINSSKHQFKQCLL